MASTPSSEASPFLACPLCDRPLLLRPTDASVTLQCADLHEFTFGHLLKTAPPVLRNGLQFLLENWKRRRDSILLAADDARKRCLPDVGDLFLHHARTLGNHIELLVGALRQADHASAADLGEPARVA